MGSEFWQYRPATASDSRRHIDWRRSARADSHFVRQTEWQAAQSVIIWVDDGLSMRFSGDGKRPEKGSRAKLLALAAAILLIRAGERVGLAALGDRPAAGEAQLVKLAEALTLADSTGDHGTPRARTMPPGGRAIFLSDFLGDTGHLADTLSRAADRGVSGVCVMVLDPLEEAFPFDGRTIFESMSGAVSHETLKASRLRRRYLDRLAARKEELRLMNQRAKWQFSIHHTDAPAGSALLWLHQALERSP